MQKECKYHGLTDFVNRDSENKMRCKKCSIDNVSKRRRKLKQKSIEYKGGKCCICGYNKSTWALDFHHKNPEEKDFNISSANKSWETIRKELDKCILVCKNCHAEIHENS